jgi:hypothetical protein
LVRGIFTALLDDTEIAALLGDAAQARAMVALEVALAKVQAELRTVREGFPAYRSSIGRARRQPWSRPAPLSGRAPRAASIVQPLVQADLTRQSAALEPAVSSWIY